MAKVKKTFIDSYLANKVMEAIRPLNEIKDILESSETDLTATIDNIIKKILSIKI